MAVAGPAQVRGEPEQLVGARAGVWLGMLGLRLRGRGAAPSSIAACATSRCGGEIRASDAASGELLWQRRYGKQPEARSLGSVALAGSEVVVSTRDGQLFGLDVDTGYTLWSYDIGHGVHAEPIVAKGWVYAATDDGYVVALNVADATLDGWHMFGGNASHDGLVHARQPAAQPTSL